MASAHLYVRVQVSGSNAAIDAIAQAVDELRCAVGSSQGDGPISLHVERDADPEPLPLEPTLEPERLDEGNDDVPVE